MKKVIISIFIVICAVLYVNVNAKCDYKKQVDLASDAANIKIKYEVATKNISGPDIKCDGAEGDPCSIEIDYFKVHILNLNDDFYLTVSNDFNNKKETYNSKIADENGIVTFDWMNVTTVTNFTFNVYSSDTSECGGEHLRTIYLTTPRKNNYYYYDMCDGHEDLYVCDKFVTSEEVSFDEFSKAIENAEKKNEKDKDDINFFEKIFDFIKNHKGIMIGSAVAVVIIAGGVVIIVRKRNNIWK